MGFSQLKFHPAIAAGIREAGYSHPTPIQKAAIPEVLAGRDVLGLAQTGTGKTAAFALPILHRLCSGPRKRPRALIVAPTRELAEQIDASFKLFAHQSGLKSITIYGGVGQGPQVAALKKGVEILVCCPGRLLDLTEQGHVDLSAIEVVVLDEADQMFDMGFLPMIRKILARLPKQRQTLLFSATMPAEIRGLAQEMLKNPATVQVDRVKPAATVKHALFPVEPHLKTALLLQILAEHKEGSVVVFTRTKYRAKRLGEQLAKAGHKAVSLQGNLSQNRRQEAMDGFRDGSYQIMVATDIAARGIDVNLISLVVNYDVPEVPEMYVHRIGRTGRAERTGAAMTFVAKDDAATVRAIEKLVGKEIEKKSLKGFDYSVPAPHKDAEFARPPREPQQRKKPQAAPGGRGARPAASQAAGTKAVAAKPVANKTVANKTVANKTVGNKTAASKPADTRTGAAAAGPAAGPGAAPRSGKRRRGGRGRGKRS